MSNAENTLQSIEEKLQAFVAYCDEHVTGDEKGEAQVFLDRLMQAFGHGGVKECGGTLEERIKKSKADGGGTSFADFVWKPHVLVEMKKRGADLARHYQQAFQYWERLVPGRPRYVVLCNFDEFWVYDFETQLDEPVDKLALADLPNRWGPLAFLKAIYEPPVFKNNQEEVTRKAADRLAELFGRLTARGVDSEEAQRFVLQCLVTLFAEDIGLLPKYFFARLLDECDSSEKAYDLIGGLFRAMNTERGERGGRYRDVAYFNGGLFAEPVSLELAPEELNQLKRAAEADWAKVRPEIFGTIFEHSLGAEKRHAYGAHFTSGVDIMKIVRPTIIEPWEKLIERAASRKNKTTRRRELLDLQAHLSELRVLDPACGSGNFLYLAYRSMKRLERRLLDELAGDEGRYGLVNASQFYGMDIQPFAVELAKVTMMIARKLAIDELGIQEQALPLDNLDANFVTGDALITLAPDGSPTCTLWPPADVIIGNPPFLGGREVTEDRGAKYGEHLEAIQPDITRRADYCVYWLRRAYDHLPLASDARPWKGRAGLVGTQNIRNNESREGGLDLIASSGTIVEAVENQPWSGEANVHVSIVNWVKHERSAETQKLFIPGQRRLWHVVDMGRTRVRRKKGSGPASKEYELDCRLISSISSALSHMTDVSAAIELACNRAPKCVFEGLQPGHVGFRINLLEKNQLLKGDPSSSEVLFGYLTGSTMLSGKSLTKPEFLIDFGTRNQVEAVAFKGAFALVRDRVLPLWETNAEAERSRTGKTTGEHQRRLQTWWQLKRGRRELTVALDRTQRYIACSRHLKRPVFVFLSTEFRPDSALTVFALDDDYSFGVIQSAPHWKWFFARCSNLKSDFRYTPGSVFDTFPWPQSPKDSDVDAVAEAGRAVRRVRDDALTKIKGGLRALYKTLETPGKHPLRNAHAELDKAVMKAYGFSPKKDLLKQLLDLNHEVAERIERDEPVTAPGVPPGYGDPAALITDDCIRPAE